MKYIPRKHDNPSKLTEKYKYYVGKAYPKRPTNKQAKRQL